MNSIGIPTPEHLHQLISVTEKKMVETSLEYGLAENDIPDRNLQKLALIAKATTHVEAATLARKAWDSLFLTVLVMWKNKKITGPITADSLEKTAKQAEGLATMLENKGHEEAAKKQKVKAAGLRKEAMTLRVKG